MVQVPVSFGPWAQEQPEPAKRPHAVGPGMTTVEQLVATYLRNAEGRNRCQTVVSMRCSLRDFVAKFGDREIGDVRPYDLDQWVAGHSQEVAPSTLRRELSWLRAFYNTLRRWEVLDTNPVTPNLFPHLTRKSPTILAGAELEAYLKRAKRVGPSFYGAVMTGLYAGLRRGELCALEWQDVSETELWVRSKPENLVKDHQERRIPTHPELWRIFAALPQRATWCFPSRRGAYWQPPEFQDVARCAGIHGFHILRRTFATRCLQSGVDVRTVQRWLGHSSLVVTERYLSNGRSDEPELMSRLSFGEEVAHENRPLV
jgi:integrase